MDLEIKNNVKVPAEVFAQSAFDNEVGIDDFVASLNMFSDQAYEEGKQDRRQIIQWREETTECFFKLLKDAGKLKHVEKEFFGGSDCGDDEDDPSCSK